MELIKSFKMLDDTTIEIIYNDNVEVSLEGIKAAWILLDEFTASKRLKKLTIVGKNTRITHEARKYGFAESMARNKYIIAEAMVVHTLPQKMVANFYERFIKKVYPIKYFTEVEEAKEWLNAIQDNN